MRLRSVWRALSQVLRPCEGSQTFAPYKGNARRGSKALGCEDRTFDAPARDLYRYRHILRFGRCRTTIRHAPNGIRR